MEYWITAIVDRQRDELFHYVYPAESREEAAKATRWLFDSAHLEVLETSPYVEEVWPNVTPEGAE